jgi:hypothetical protein
MALAEGRFSIVLIQASLKLLDAFQPITLTAQLARPFLVSYARKMFRTSMRPPAIYETLMKRTLRKESFEAQKATPETKVDTVIPPPPSPPEVEGNPDPVD